MGNPFLGTNEVAYLDQHQARQVGAAGRVATLRQSQVDATTRAAARYPYLTPGVALALGQSESPDQVVDQIAQREAERQAAKPKDGEKRKGSWLSRAWDGAYGGLKAGVRGLITGLSAPLELAQADWREITTGQISGGFIDPGDVSGRLGQTTIGQTARQAVTEGEVNAGSGFIPSGTVYQQQVEASRNAAAIELSPGQAAARAEREGYQPEQIKKGGETGVLVLNADGEWVPYDIRSAVTPGRSLANLVTEPGTRPYSIISGLTDAAIAIKDPTPGKIGKTITPFKAKPFLGAPVEVYIPNERTVTARIIPGTPPGKELVPTKGVVSTGVGADRLGAPTTGKAVTPDESFKAPVILVDGVRKTIIPEDALSWLDSTSGARVIDYLATETDFERMRRATGRKLPVDFLLQMRDATTPAQVRALLTEELGRGRIGEAIRVAPGARGQAGMETSWWGIGAAKLRRPPVRLAQLMPGTHVDLDDAESAVEQLDRLQRTMKVPEAKISANNEAMARATTRAGRYTVLSEVMGGTRDSLIAAGFAPATANKVTRLFTDSFEKLRAYYVDEIGENARVPGAVIGGDGKPMASPHLFVEYLAREVPLPNARAVRRAVSTWAPVLENPAVRATSEVLDFATSSLFKPLALARAAWTVRVIGEEQTRLAFAGLNSSLHHPIAWLAAVVGDGKNGKIEKLLANVITPKYGKDATGQTFRAASALQGGLDGFGRALSRDSTGYLGRGRDHAVYSRAFTTYGKEEPEYVRAWAEEIAQLAADPVAQHVAKVGAERALGEFWDGSLAWARKDLMETEARFADRAYADAWVRSVGERIATKTRGLSDLVDAVATGRLGNNPVSDGIRVNKFLTQRLAQLVDDGPIRVKGRIGLRERGEMSSPFVKMAQTWDNGVEAMFTMLMSIPTNKLTRSPAFRQTYWDDIERLLPLMDIQARSRVVTVARKSLPKAQVRRMEKTLHEASGRLSAAQADQVAKGRALNQTRKLLYDLHDQANWSDILRNIFPFGEAWREVMTTWTRLIARNPQIPYRIGQAVQGAREQGFFFTNDQGEETFAYPGSSMISDLLTGVPAGMEAPVSGLNMVTSSLLPGFGPVVQIPAGEMLPDTPTWDTVKKVVLPYGEEDIEGGFLESLAPAWLQRMRTAMGHGSPDQQRAYANMQGDVMSYLYSTGDYDITTPEGQRELVAAAKFKARNLMVLRGMAAFGAPASPSYAFSAKVPTKEGDRLILLHKLADEYRKLQEEDYTTATAKFEERYGELAVMAVVPKSSGGNLPTEAAWNYSRDHPEIASSYPELYGYFAEGSSDFSYALYKDQFATGQRRTTDATDRVERVNAMLAQAIYGDARAQVAGRTDAAAQEWLRGIRNKLVVAYPGYNPAAYAAGKVEGLIADAYRIVTEDAVKDTPTGEALATYLEARDMALSAAQEAGLASHNDAKAARGLRNWLRNIGENLATENTGFAQLWDRVLSREMTDDAEEADNGIAA